MLQACIFVSPESFANSQRVYKELQSTDQGLPKCRCCPFLDTNVRYFAVIAKWTN